MQISFLWARAARSSIISATSRASRRAAGALATVLVLFAGAMPAAAQAQGLPDFTVLVENVGGSVVNIRTTERHRIRGSGGPEMDEDMLEFFKRFGVPIPGQQSPRRPTSANSRLASSALTSGPMWRWSRLRQLVCRRFVSVTSAA
jgi:serine protease Do